MGNKHKTLRLFILGSKVLSPPIAFLFIFLFCSESTAFAPFSNLTWDTSAYRRGGKPRRCYRAVIIPDRFKIGLE